MIVKVRKIYLKTLFGRGLFGCSEVYKVICAMPIGFICFIKTAKAKLENLLFETLNRVEHRVL